MADTDKVINNIPELDSLSLPKKPNLELADGVLGSFLSGQSDVFNFGISDASKYTDYGVKFSRFRDPDMDRAKNQSNWGQAGNALGNIVGEGIIGTGVSGIGSIAEVAMMAFQEGETDFNNSIIQLGENIKEASREVMPIYRENPNQTFNVGDFAWWADNSVSVGSTLGLMIPGMGITKGLGLVGQGLSALGKTEALLTNAGKFGKAMSKALTVFDRTGDAAKYWGKVMGTSIGMRHAENFGESLQTYNQTKQESLDLFNGMEEGDFRNWKNDHVKLAEEVAEQTGKDFMDVDKFDIANHIANKAGWRTYQLDAGNLLFDMVQVMPLFKGFKYNTRTSINSAKVTKAHMASMGTEMTKELSRKVFKNRITNAIVHGTVARQLTEGIEETVNAMSQQEGNYYGKQLLGTAKEKGGGERLAEYLRDPATWEQAFWGVMGGVAFSGGTSALNKTRNIIKGVDPDHAENMRVAEIAGRTTEITRTGVLLNSIKNNINPYTGKIIEGSPETIEYTKQALQAEVIANTALSLGISASKHGNLNLLLEQLKSDNFKKEVKEKYQLADDAEVDAVVSKITSETLKAERLYKDYHNRFATANINPAVKDLLISDAIWLEHSRDRIKKNQSDIANVLTGLKNTTTYQALADKFNTANEGKTFEEATDLEANIEHAAITELLDQFDIDVDTDDIADNYESLNTRWESYKQKLIAKRDEIEKNNPNLNGADRLILQGLDAEILDRTAEHILATIELADNSKEAIDLVSNLKAKAKEKEDALRAVAEKKLAEQLAELDKAVVDAGEDEDRLKGLSTQVDTVISENQIIADKFKPLKDKITNKIAAVQKSKQLRQSAIKERTTYIDQLTKSKGTIAYDTLRNKRNQKVFTEQFNAADLAEIDRVIAELDVASKPPVEPKSDAKLADAFISFISSDITGAIVNISPIYGIMAANTSATELRLSADHIKRLKEFKSHMIATLAKMEQYKSLGEIYNKELNKVVGFLQGMQAMEAGKTIIDIDGGKPNPDVPIPTLTEELELISDQELIDGINQIASNLGIDTTLKSAVGEDVQGQAMLEQHTFGLNIIRMLALQNAGLPRGSKLENTNYSFNNVLGFIYSKVNKNHLSNPIFVDTLRNLFNNVVNAGIIAKEQYVENRIDINDFLNTMKESEIQKDDLKEDTTMFISPISGMNKNTKDGDIVATAEQAIVISDLNGLQIGDEVTVEVDTEKSKLGNVGDRSTDVLQADMKITHKGVVIGHLNIIYDAKGTPTSFHGGMPYTVEGSWTDAAIKHLTVGKLVREFELMKHIKDARMKTGLPFNQLMDEYGQELLKSPIIDELVNFGRKDKINPIDNRTAYYNAVNHIMNTFSHGTINGDFNSAELIKSLNNWNNRVRSDIANGLKLRNDMKTNGVTSITIPIKDKTSGSIIKSKNKAGKPIHRRVDKVFGSIKDIVLMATGKRKSVTEAGSEINSINKEGFVFSDRVYHEGTIYVVGKCAKSRVNPLGLMPFNLITTDVTDDRVSTKGKEYSEKLVAWIANGIKNITDSKGTFTDADILNFVKDMQSKVVGVESVKGKINAITINSGNKHYRITFNKTVTSIYEGVDNEKSKKVFDSNDAEYATQLDAILRGLKRNFPLNKDNKLDNYNDTDSKDIPIYVDVVTGNIHDSFTEYAITTELLVTDYGAVIDGKGNIISNTTVDPTGMFNDGQRMIVTLDQNKAVGKEKEKEKEKVNPFTNVESLATELDRIDDITGHDFYHIMNGKFGIRRYADNVAVAKEYFKEGNLTFRDKNGNKYANIQAVEDHVNEHNVKVKESSKISEMVDDDTSPYVELFDMAIAAGATFSDEIVDDAGYAQIDKASLVIRATRNFVNGNLLKIAKQKFLAHEALHAITLSRLTDEHRERLLDIDDSLRKAYEAGELDNVLSEGERKVLQQVFDAIGNIGDEVLTYAFTNSIYARALNAVKSDTETKESRTLWDSFMLMIAKMIPNTKLSEIKDIMNEVMGVQDSVADKVLIKDRSTYSNEDIFKTTLFGNSIPASDYKPISEFLNSEGELSTSALQRKLLIGYNKALKIIKEYNESKNKEEESVDEQDIPLDEDFNNDGIMPVAVSDTIETYLGSSVLDYMKGKSKSEREFLRTKINDGTIVFKC